ncbi:MAG: tRNA (guanosine(46)-N7)-methyltransferase TrmB [gamma proteobacterium endosymbiont of Lamellibrachia anaximandri]|nr:tRNA (guanosine(46)-N7)-methyltransferase TrmB [gamma proteobacterium endosymbiont of Lamellibrachia anaximandri]MBL3532630.1 tRNA (guanosine(46)-N7)-methyltransferase TrmB [gamma proteobacterium endosymbiont of Lamellibrachia anaximandri]MBL3599046.1 tRNA (guanosine(46)-N7)-methyltransferase TrmB [gamma proteobacterium endosymbiont of Lamellibrachia anaximandri]
MEEETSTTHPPIRSFVLRQGRTTQAQRRAFEELWPRYGLELPATDQIDPTTIFGNSHPLFLEIGCGNGETLSTLAARHPEQNYLGVEVHGPGVGSLMLKLEESDSDNARVLKCDAMELLRHHLPVGCLDGLYLFFPDPWPKKKHHKRRIVQPEFTQLVQRALRPGGFLHMATDWEDYAEQMLLVLSEATGFENSAGQGNFSPRPADRTLTHFEQRGQRLGHGVWDLIFRRCD